MNPVGSRACLSCGEALQGLCVRCGETYRVGARFCSACGTPVDKRTLVDIAAPSAEIKQATILFADIVSSTRLISAMSAEETMLFLAPVVTAMAEIVLRFEGTIGRTLGDGVMALFGAPQAHEGHAVLACEAATAMHALSERFPGVELRVGMHSGEVVINSSSSNVERALLLHGVAIHLASRVVAMAEPGTTCLTAETLAAASPHYEAVSLGARQAQGFDRPVQIHRLTGPRPPHPVYEATRGVGRGVLRGRAIEMAALQQALADVQGGASRVVGVVGPPGSGKSRLCGEFLAWCRQQRQQVVVEARAQIYGNATPLQPLLEFVRSSLLDVSAEDEPSAVRERIAELTQATRENPVQKRLLLAEFLGVAQDDAEPVGMAAHARRERLFSLVCELVLHRAQDGLILFFEDLHWLDAGTAEFLSTLIQAVQGKRILLLVNYRPSFAAPWMKEEAFSEIALKDLEEGEVVELVEDLIGSRSEIRELAMRIARRSSGNPFFAEEMIRALMADGTLVGEASGFTVAAKAQTAPLPNSVQAVIGARIDQLDESSKSLLQLCAILGKDFHAGVLGRIMGLDNVEVARLLDGLCELEFLVAQSRADMYAFRHPLIQEVAYRTQLKTRRAPLHALVARAMEDFHARRIDEFAGLIAHHYEAAGQTLDAARQAARAAGWISATDTSRAIEYWQSVREWMMDQADTPENNVLRSRASTQIAWLGWREGITVEQAKPLIDEALAWARRDDHRMIPMLLFLEGRIHVASGGASDYYADLVRQGLKLLDTGDAGRRATLNVALCQALGRSGLLLEGLAACDAALAEIEHVDAADEQFLGYRPVHWAMNLRGRILLRMCRFSEALDSFRTMLAIDEREVDPTVRFIAHMGCLEIAAAKSQPEIAAEHAMEVERIATRHPSPYLRVFSLTAHGLSAEVAGQTQLAIDAYAEALALLRSSRAAMEYESELVASLAECHLQLGATDRAQEFAKVTLSMARSRTQRLPQCRAYMVLAALAMEANPLDRQEWSQYLALAEQLIDRTGAVIHLPQLTMLRARTLSLRA
ncbi:MAG: AAA family ATPase [Proteobacteria bacterium]|nr:AAA family ATPase [Pseudomonadota bacterium]